MFELQHILEIVKSNTKNLWPESGKMWQNFW